MSSTEKARQAVERAEQHMDGNRVDEAQVYALIAIARQLERLADKS